VDRALPWEVRDNEPRLLTLVSVLVDKDKVFSREARDFKLRVNLKLKAVTMSRVLPEEDTKFFSTVTEDAEPLSTMSFNNVTIHIYLFF
jgi:hypothetical protein